MTSVTIELTNYCPNDCKYCSSNATSTYDTAMFVKYETVVKFLLDKRYDTIILSGGEPLAHPSFYDILRLCKKHSDHVVVYTNELGHIVYNAGVIDGVRVDANVTVLDSTKTVKILKRVEQGREARRPDVTFSRNFTGDCRGCGESVLLPDGTIVPSPCSKETIIRVDERTMSRDELLDSIHHLKNYISTLEMKPYLYNDIELLTTILDAMKRCDDVFIKECRGEEGHTGRWIVSQNCVTEKITYIKELIE